jgi:hypothetical protein
MKLHDLNGRDYYSSRKGALYELVGMRTFTSAPELAFIMVLKLISKDMCLSHVFIEIFAGIELDTREAQSR